MSASVSEEPLGDRPRKRRRKVLACGDCRRRKVQCDRRLPVCTRCAKAGKADSCSYEDESDTALEDLSGLHEPEPQSALRLDPPVISSDSSMVTISTHVWTDLLARLMHQERELATVKQSSMPAMLSRVQPTADARQHDNTSSTVPDQSTVLRGHGFSTRYFGPTDLRNIMTRLRDVSEFTRSSIERSPTLSRTTKDMWAFKSANKTAKALRKLEVVQDLQMLLPLQTECDRRVDLYLAQIESVYSVLHVPTFMSEYKQFWQDPNSHRQAFVGLLLALMSCASCLAVDSPCTYIGESSSTRETAGRWADACEAWLEEQSFKHTTLTNLQIRCLLVMSRKINRLHSKRAWVDTGHLIDFLVNAGFHRSPSHTQKPTTALEGEMRRRLWTLAVELDLQASLDRGMHCHSAMVPIDTEGPTNIHDEELYDSMPSLPRSRPCPYVTKATYLHLSAISIGFRRRLAAVLNQAHWNPTREELMQYIQQVEDEIDQVDTWSVRGPTNAATTASPPQPDLALSLLKMQLQQYLCMLHCTALQRGEPNTVVTRFHSQGFFAAAQAQVHLHADVIASGVHALHLMREDITCKILWITRNCERALASRNGKPGDLNAWLDLLKAALGLLETKFERIGMLEPSSLIAYSAPDYLRLKMEAITDRYSEWSSMEQLTKMCVKIVESQDPQFRAQVEKVDHGQPTPESLVQGGYQTSDLPTTDLSTTLNEELAPADVLEFSAWPLEEWMFDPIFADP